MKPTENKKPEKDSEQYPGVAIDIADDDKVTEKTVKQDVSKLGFNPRNEGKKV